MDIKFAAIYIIIPTLLIVLAIMFKLTVNRNIIDKHAIFCLTPFSLDGLEVFKVVREVCSSKSYRAFRGDEKYIPGDIFSEIIRYIIHSRLIIADLNGKNPNVFYELGIAQAFSKTVILLAHRDSPIPFDISNNRIIYRQISIIK